MNYQIQFQKIQNLRYFAEEFTVFLVVKGNLWVEEDGQETLLQEAEVYWVNLNHYLKLTAEKGEATILFLTVNSYFFASQLPSFFNLQFLSPQQKEVLQKQTSLSQLKTLLAEIGINEYSEKEERQMISLLKLQNLLLILVENFQKEQRHSSGINENYQIKEILNYIEEHYNCGLSVKDIADHLFMTESTLSKNFKQDTGEYLSHYIKNYQIKKSLPELRYSKKSIEQIASDHGFNSGKVYRDQFKQFLKQTPTAYRNAHHEAEQHKQNFAVQLAASNLNDQNLKALYEVVERHQTEASQPIARRTKSITVDQKQLRKTKTDGQVIIHIACLSELKQLKIQQELTLLKEKKMVHWISCRRLFPDQLTSFLMAKEAQLNSFPVFEELDEACAFIEKNQLKLMLDLSQERYQKHFKEILPLFFKYLFNKFGGNFLQNIALNVIFPSDSQEQAAFYFEVYQKVKVLQGEIQIGFQLPLTDPYSTNQVDLEKFLTSLVGHFDFITYGANPNFVFQEGQTERQLEKYHHYILHKTRFILQLLRKNKITVPLFLTEWNTLTGTTIDYNGLFFRGAIILQDLLGLEELIDGFGFWLSIGSREAQHYVGHANVGLELFHLKSHRRPSFFCLEILKRLEGEIIAQEDFYLLLAQRERYQLLIWNTNYFDPHLSSQQAFLESHSLEVQVQLKQIFSGRYQVKQLDLNRHYGALFYQYSKFQQAAVLDAETEEYVDYNTRPRLQVFDCDIKDVFKKQLQLDTNGITLLEFTPLN